MYFRHIPSANWGYSGCLWHLSLGVLLVGESQLSRNGTCIWYSSDYLLQTIAGQHFPGSSIMTVHATIGERAVCYRMPGWIILIASIRRMAKIRLAAAVVKIALELLAAQMWSTCLIVALISAVHLWGEAKLNQNYIRGRCGTRHTSG